jgi:hypothetical protein
MLFRKLLAVTTISLGGVLILPLPEQVTANTPLNKAVIQKLRNFVQLLPQNQPKRAARQLDSMIPGDGLSTGRASLADLRFNDGSLARVGEQAIFKFLPKTRTFTLSNGTVLLLIPPGRGQTRLRTPNAAAAIRGSALFVRYDYQTDTTIVGALTESGIKIFNQDASQSQELKAGQLIVVVKGKFKSLYDFDLRTFYETSELVRDLDLSRSIGVPNPDPAIASVQAETAAAVAKQSPIVGQGVVENPSFIQLTTTSVPDSLESNIFTAQDTPVNSFLDIGQVLLNTLETPTDNNVDSITTDTVTPGSGSPLIPTQVETPAITPPSVETPPEPVTPPSVETPPEPVTPPSVETPPEPVTPPSVETPPEPVTPPSVETPPEPVTPPSVETPPEPVTPPSVETPPEPVTPPSVEPPEPPVKIST